MRRTSINTEDHVTTTSRSSITVIQVEADVFCADAKMNEATKTEMKAFMRNTMMELQQPLLQAAADNAKQIVETSLKQCNTKLKDEIDEEIAECSNNDKLKNNINQSNLDFCRQIKDIWKKAERAVNEKDTQKSTQYFEKGKEIIKNRTQALRIADKEGWDTALAFLDDPLVDGPDQEKRLKKARTTVQTNKSLTNKWVGNKKRENNAAYDYAWRLKRRNFGQDDERRSFSNYQTVNTNNKKSGGQSNTCWSCNRFGHFSSNCPNNNDNKSYRY